MTTTSISAPAPTTAAGGPVTGRLEALSAAVWERRSKRRPLEIRRVLLVVGSSLMGLGVVAILLGWYGAAHSAFLFQEVPYLISGGLLGVALVAGGGFLFFAAWLVRLSEENRQYADRLEETLDRLDQALATGVLAVAPLGDQPTVPGGSPS